MTHVMYACRNVRMYAIYTMHVYVHVYVCTYIHVYMCVTTQLRMYVLVATVSDALQTLRDGVPTQKYPV